MNTRERILARLNELEVAEGIKIVYACESGSRAWGFPSANSDYDIRFLYVHPVEWYLSIEEKRDVIECQAEGNLDINGWDLRKALGLFRRSNPPLFEWLNSPIVYLEKGRTAARMRELMPVFYSPAACIHHYLHMTQGNYREYLQGDVVWIKKYFYVLRPILAIKWIEKGFGVAPTAFGTLLERLVTDPALYTEINTLIEQKRNGAELDRGPRIPLISEFIERELSRIETEGIKYKSHQASSNELNELFRNTLAELWQSPLLVAR